MLRSQDLADWRFNRILLPPWNQRPHCTCVATIDTCDIDASNLLARRRYFKCDDLDLDFIVLLYLYFWFIVSCRGITLTVF
jgi:hypothetical protein